MARAPLGKHGRDHRPPGTYGPDDPGGHDPIDINVNAVGFTRRAVSLDTAYLNVSHLEAWWRLGEAGPFPTGAASTTNFAADSSSHGRNLTAVNDQDGSPYITSGTDPLLPTMDIAGALTFGDPAINDGAIRWHAVPGGTVDHPIRVRLESTGGDDTFGEQSFGSTVDGSSHGLAVGEGFSVTAWLKFEADSLTTGFRPILSTVKKDFGVNPTGWELGWDFSTTKVVYHTYNSDGSTFSYTASVGSASDEWFLFVMTLSRDTSTQYTRRFYLNTVLDSETVDTHSVVAPSSHGQVLCIGGGNDHTSDGTRVHSPGATDEVAVFSKALSTDEIANLYNVQVASGDTWTTETVPLAGGLDTTGASAGDVPVYDGSTLAWGLPKIKSYHNGA